MTVQNYYQLYVTRSPMLEKNAKKMHFFMEIVHFLHFLTRVRD